MALKKPEASARPSSPSAPVCSPEFARQFPHLAAYLAETSWEDGTPRQTSTIMLLIEDSAWKGCLNDRALERSLWRAGATIVDVLTALEAALDSGTSDWRRWSGRAPKKR